jgi:hypothetical protein
MSGVQVMLFADRLEVWNPGSLPEELTVAQLKEPHRSVPRKKGSKEEKAGRDHHVSRCVPQNIPTVEYQAMVEKQQTDPLQIAYQRRNRDLDPQLVWHGKDMQDWDTLNSAISRPFNKPKDGRIAVKVINHLGDEVMKVFRVK